VRTLNRRQILRLLRVKGFVQVRSTKHAIWKHPNGTTISLPMGKNSQRAGFTGPTIKLIMQAEEV
jgi:predicted RNA binding protein YcfA (HicA-like mRNA interferase family)